MKKYQVSLALGIILILGLAGCNGNKQSNQHQNKEKAAMSAKMANDDSSASESSSTSSSLTHYKYKVPKSEKQNRDYVADGHLTNKHQFSYDRFGTKQQLAKKATPSSTFNSDKVTYRILNVRVLKNSAKTSAAKQAASQVLNLSSVPDTYYTFVINYEVTNQQQQTIALNGVSSVKTNQGQTLQTSNQLTDSSAGSQIPAGKSRQFVMNGYLYHYDKDPASNLAINFGPIFDTKGTKIASAPSHALQVTLS
ncbi:hypothetical protein [Lentilactobacillus hilgardii]|uniref:DUF5067 domain-containing protein n=1 Tax=Lentilactobacillus hilgardii (strain ATCC 8290 / DSM 20176 / CCUG 30140 / JCM 1155 / KCTC 3500 / NBRC 15886 / NCIMB 8040 / NRRL B-1843 / 9) TaxID=1423757 RepID=C0XKS5_LENH9|nr:hypothetical protein [Lentilactobacillus hilgardii]EEI19850.1 hypothetical protein HMPREF0497_1266 [Lentilactobacillus buchneri ATCC 11577]EEI24017.1 hypothetical protein HMPREF0519_1836 [Lentilactobacillus hilgardii DSM 20176 = ATCC 8290]KRK57924.1 hypothetical protein FD42_GL001916 [Lentilactobacillus hilgardii DSM 20176 = ATCC 8290]MCP9332696.1 hypothetical protein [Lentilactobacillus hilgardii]MCP9349397.1 hypothetical protein [Lentilactobacillus hilgardii]